MKLLNRPTEQCRDNQFPFYSPDKMASHVSRLESEPLTSIRDLSVRTFSDCMFHPALSSAQREKVADFSPPNETLGKTILLADDDSAVRAFVKNVLVNEGYVVVLARDGQRAVDLTNEVPVDLILLDVNIPDKNGWDIFEELTREHPVIPVIIVTARPNQLFTAICAGAGALLEKPLDSEMLLETIGALLGEPKEHRLARLVGQNSSFHYKPFQTLLHQLEGR